jgi:glycosyltransferase involved in cell wall biosynthesis
MRTTLLIPTLNEIEGMKVIMPLIKREWVDQILVVDGGSTDGTLEYAQEMGYDTYVQKRKGIRHAYIEALPLMRGDVIITFSPDGNSLAELILPLVEKMKEGYDMVIVSRYAKGARSEDDDLVTGFGNWMFRTLINIFYSANYTDPMVIYRAWKKDVFCRLDLDKDSSYAAEERMFQTQIGLEPLLSIRAAKCGLRLAEIPGDEPPRVGGERKLQIIRWGAAYLFEVFAEKFRWKCTPPHAGRG